MTPENKRIVFLSGYSAAGKSTLARELQDNYGYNLVEHQPLVHGIAQSKGYERARHWLADVGVDQFAEESAREMAARTRKLVKEGEAKIVFDVAYGFKMLELFQTEFPDIFRVVVAVLADEETRTKHIQKRMGSVSKEDAEKELHFRDGFLHTVGVDEVLQQKDIEVTTKDRPVHEIASELNILIEEHLSEK